jgi:hypothetical protein
MHLAVAIVSVPELALCQFTAFLGFQGESSHRPGFQSLESNLVASFFTVAVASILNTL